MTFPKSIDCGFWERESKRDCAIRTFELAIFFALTLLIGRSQLTADPQSIDFGNVIRVWCVYLICNLSFIFIFFFLNNINFFLVRTVLDLCTLLFEWERKIASENILVTYMVTYMVHVGRRAKTNWLCVK